MKSIENYSIQEDIVSRTVQGEEVLVDLVSGTYYGLNEVGTFIWQEIKKNKSSNEIAIALCEAYDIGLDEAEKDIIKLFNDLNKKGVVKIH